MADLRGALGMVGGVCRSGRILAAFVFLFLLLPAAGRATTYADPQVRWWGGGATLQPDAGAACAARYSGGSLCGSAYGVTSPALYDPSASYYPGHAWAFCCTAAWPCSSTQGPQVAVYTQPVCAAGWELVALPDALGRYMIQKCQPVVACPDHASGPPCVCVTGYHFDAAGTSCVLEQYTITLSGGSSTEPATLLPFTATVTDQNGVAQAGKQVTITPNVRDGTGGHIHTAGRPKGLFTCSSLLGTSSVTCALVTDYSGQASFIFVATPVSGTHTITATCNGCSNTETKSVDVKVNGLIPIPSSSRYALQDSAGTVIGAIPGKHTANHYLTSTSIAGLKKLADLYKTVSPQAKLYLNDASLEWGGLFDVGSSTPWSSPHSLHHKGRSLDIRAANSGPNNEGAVPVTVFLEFIDKARRKKFNIGLHCKNSSDTNYCLGQPNNRHFHIDF